MILIDSSAWIEYYKPGGDKTIKDQVYKAIQNDEAAINGLIRVETAGFARDTERPLILSDFSAFHNLQLSDPVFEKAVTICSTLRKTGITIPTIDAIIAASALEAGAALVHRDNHFIEISRHFPLR